MRRPLAVVAALTVAAASYAAAPSPASASAGRVVISEVYGGGGSTTSAWKRDYVELYNPGTTEVDLSTWSVQYRSSGGLANPTGVTKLTGTIAPKSYYLVAEAAGTVGTDLPASQDSGTISMSGTAGTVFLSDQQAALTAPATGSVVGTAGIVDLVGYGATNTFETKATAAPSTTTSVARDAAGKDADDNSTDLVVGDGTPGAAPAGGAPPSRRSRRPSRRSRAPAPAARWPGRTSPPAAWSPRRTRPAASTGSSSRPPAPAARSTRTATPAPTRSSSTAARRRAR